MNNVVQNKHNYKTTVYMTCIIAALGGLLFGLDQGFIANSLATISNVYHLSIHAGEQYAAVLASGGVLGALLSGWFARLLGRKKSLVIAGFLFSLLSLISALLPPLPILIACRFGLGFAVGIASFMVPLYLSESAPTKIRGSMGSLFQLMITIGIFAVSLINVTIARMVATPENALPIMFVVLLIFSLTMFIGSLILPESPRWLMLKHRKSEAIAVLRKILNTAEEVESEIREIELTLAQNKGNNLSIIFKGYFCKLIVMGVLLQMFQQLVGINLMIYYAPTIFAYANMKGFLALMMIPTVNMLFTIPSVRLVEKWGRKKLLYVGAVVMAISLVAAGLAFQVISTNDAANATQILPKSVLMIASIVYIFGFAVSWGPVAWIICSEVFPLEVREVGMTITTIVNWTFAGIVMDNALSFMHKYGNASIFYVFAVFCVLSIIFLKLFVPETKGVTLEKLEMNLKAGNALRNLGDN